MSYKLTCPSCDRYTSELFRAYEDGRSCPYCGGSLQASSDQYYRQLPDYHRAAPSMRRFWCCNTPIDGPHATGCSFEPSADKPIDYTGPAIIDAGPQFTDSFSRAEVGPAWEQLRDSFVGAPGLAALQAASLRYGSSRPRPAPVNGVVWEYRSPADGSTVYVKHENEVWHAAPTPFGRWDRDDRIPEWPGTFTPLLQPVSSMSRRDVFGFVLVKRGAAKTPEAAAAAYDDMVRAAREEQSDAQKAALDAIRLMTERKHVADVAGEEAQIRTALTELVRRRISEALEGHRAFPLGAEAQKQHAIATAAETAVAAVQEFYRAAQRGEAGSL